jgi:hypothetical protein
MATETNEPTIEKEVAPEQSDRRTFLKHAGRAAAGLPAAVLLLNAAATSSFAQNPYKGKKKNPPPPAP